MQKTGLKSRKNFRKKAENCTKILKENCQKSLEIQKKFEKNN